MGDPSRYTDEIVISWPELHRDARVLSQELHGLGTWQGIIAITRGGLVPAALVARELEIRLIDTVCVSSYAAGAGGGAAQAQGGVQVLKGVAGDGAGFLLIDDLVDTGKTAQVVRSTAAAYRKSRRPSATVNSRSTPTWLPTSCCRACTKCWATARPLSNSPKIALSGTHTSVYFTFG